MKRTQLESDWLIEANIDEIQQKLTAYQVTSKELVYMYLHRIAAYDKSGPAINSILEINPEALQIAAALDYERKTKGIRGPLHGIPILIKDNIDTADRMHTSAGSLVLAESYAKEDATVVKAIRKAGGIILGKTNLTEWANFIAENMPSGYSSRGGQVVNPYGKDFTVGGSSSGSGAAIAASLAAASVGTETSGSILSPASQNALVGIKPTIGLISRSGIIPISHTQDTAGPMARTVKDAALLLNVLQGEDQKDQVTLSNELTHIDFTSYLLKDGLKGKKIGVARSPYFDNLSESMVQVIDKAIEEIRELGAIVIDPIQIPSADEEWDMNVMLYEFKSDLNAYLNTIDSKHGIHSIEDVIRKNEEIGEKALKYGQKIMLDAGASSGNLTEAVYLDSLLKDGFQSRENGIDAVRKVHDLDAIVFPSYYGSSIAAKAGYPSITVPAGFSAEGEPVGITFTSSAFTEPALLEIAYSFEQGTHHRAAPSFCQPSVLLAEQ
ncbi:amidase family protein [Oceanobacillus massiliensis]|uniref:amidase family protein n=1 Tax=Oceanobacillus massiliensis TaxID=1465765 RepID=UPI0002898928|nr:amidase family protein [Oceanobacillus massiliensis]